jgi:hypothetical protein
LWRCVIEGVRRADAGIAAELASAPEMLRLALWGHLFYPAYRDLSPDEPGIRNALNDTSAAPSLIEQLRAAFALGAHRLGDRFPFLIEALAGPSTTSNLIDSGRYFANENGVGSAIRQVVATELTRCWAAGERVLLMAHSFGSVIAWETLRDLGSKAGPIDLFLTLGSPLGTRFMRSRLHLYPEVDVAAVPTTIRRWHNLAARGDVASMGRRFADDFSELTRRGLVGPIMDNVALANLFRGSEGLNSHRCYGYFINPATGRVIVDWWLGRQFDGLAG